jgi:predicted transcriptional regulator
LGKETDFTKLVADVMTTKTHVVSIQSGIQDAAKMMDKNHVHHLVVMDNGQVEGIISAMDFVKIIAKG